MILAFDVGNTHIVTGFLKDNGTLISSFRIATKDNITEDELFSYLKNNSDFHNIALTNISAVLVSSVVPNLLHMLNKLSEKYFAISPLIVNLDLVLPFTFESGLNSSGFGADRIINIVQALNLYPTQELVIFDFGTATTYEVMIDSVYVGGGILPGITMTINALVENTAQLPMIKFENPKTILGRNTVEQIQAGIFYGYVGQIKEIIARVQELYPKAFVIATGGLGKIISQEVDTIDQYLPDLSLNGIYQLYLLNK